MASALRTNVIRIGNSQGIRLSKPLLAAAGIDKEVEVSVQDGSLVIRPVRHAREGWEEQFKLMAERGDDKIGGWEDYLPTKFDEEEWEW